MEILLRTDDSDSGFSGDGSISPTSSHRFPLVETSNHNSKDNIFASFLDGRPSTDNNPTMDADIDSDFIPSSSTKHISPNITC
jgi:hypothetical protein